MSEYLDPTRAKFIEQIRHHLEGWRQKIAEDFSAQNLDKELKELSSDPVYSRFHLNSDDYVLIRVMGRMSISIGRRLGEIYDKIPRLAAQARFGLPLSEVVAKFSGLELDTRIPLRALTKEDKVHVQDVYERHLPKCRELVEGLAIEIRYNFNPNDSARLRKDKQLGKLLMAKGYTPIYLVFAENSPRLSDAVASLERAGWTFLIGQPALVFMADLVGFDVSAILDEPLVSQEIQKEISSLMKSIRSSEIAKRVFESD
jgi:hypothetical protein